MKQDTATVLAAAFIAVVSGLIVAGLIGLLAAFPIKWLWNYVVVDYAVPSMTEINFWHAWALGWLCSFLFKSSSISASKS